MICLACITAILVISFCTPVFCEMPPDLLWEATYGGNFNDQPEVILENPDGGFTILLNIFTGSNASPHVMRIDGDGAEMWNKSVDHGYYDYFRDMVRTNDNGFALAGDHGSTWDTDTRLLKIDADGNELWHRDFGLPENEAEGHTLVQTQDGGFLLTQGLFDLEWMVFHVNLIRTNSEGSKLWTRGIGPPGDNIPVDSILLEDGGFGVVGNHLQQYTYISDVWVVRTDEDGVTKWSKTLGTMSYGEFGSALLQTPDGGFLVAADRYSAETSSWDVWLIKMDEDGGTEWGKVIGGAGYETCHSIVETIDGGYAIAGTKANLAEDKDAWLFKIDPSGNIIWEALFGGSEYDTGLSLVQTADHGFAFTGRTFSFGVEDPDIYVVRTEKDTELPDFEVIVTEAPEYAEPGSTIHITAWIKNNSEETILFDKAELEFDGSMQRSRILYDGTPVPLSEGEERTETVPVSVPVNAPPGFYEVTLRFYWSGSEIGRTFFYSVVADPA